MSAPVSRSFHAATLINATLFLSGGTTKDSLNQTVILDDVLILDLSRPWKVSSPLFSSIPNLQIPLSGHTMNRVQGTSQLLVAGGESTTNSTTTPALYLYDTTQGASGMWTSPPIPANGTDALRRIYHASLTTGKDGALIQGGYLLKATVTNGTTNGTVAASGNSTVVSSLVTLSSPHDFEPESSSAVSLAKNAPALARHTMTLTPDGRAIILGGINAQGVHANMSYAYIMDTQSASAEWKVVPLSGKPPDPRSSFTTVMVNATTMLVYGGTSDYRNAFWVTFYLDLPSMTWSAPASKGQIPKRWGHTATMVGSTMVVVFGLTSHQVPDETNVALLDTTTNTWLTEYTPQSASPPNGETMDPSKDPSLSLGAVLAIAFVVTATLVMGSFWLFVRRKKRQTRNTMAKEIMGGQQTARAVLRSQDEARPHSFLGRAAVVFGGGSARNSFSELERQNQQQQPRTSIDPQEQANSPQSLIAQMAQRGHTPTDLGYPEGVVQHGTGEVPIADYIYPNQPHTMTQKSMGGQKALVVFHAPTLAQLEAVRLSKLHP
ncbi:hypothetical protein EMPS_07975 [Entomortierella parvispora]|uniref:Galactose oxidase n=1 Tax=Entomortierella parvispora TaxID=205924 RepID=A0A9P3HFZ9_9FUNG|nr:hypothetical protein EMPS_07975 [Entomortierella parvispora]